MKCIASALPLELRVAKEHRGKKSAYYVQTGIGSAQTIFALTKYLVEHPEMEELLFFGICGYIGEKKPLVQVASASHASQKKEYILPVTKVVAPLVSLWTSDVPVHDRSLLEKVGKEYVDMESWGVALVADRFKLPCTILRVPYDEVGSISCETFDKEDAVRVMNIGLSTLS